MNSKSSGSGFARFCGLNGLLASVSFLIYKHRNYKTIKLSSFGRRFEAGNKHSFTFQPPYGPRQDPIPLTSPDAQHSRELVEYVLPAQQPLAPESVKYGNRLG